MGDSGSELGAGLPVPPAEQVADISVLERVQGAHFAVVVAPEPLTPRVDEQT